jgi:hypothetical protein
MLVALLIGFATLGLAMGGYQAYRGRWLEAARVVMGCALAVASYAAMLLHKPSIAAVAALVGVAATIPYVILAKRAARTAPADAGQH